MEEALITIDHQMVLRLEYWPETRLDVIKAREEARHKARDKRRKAFAKREKELNKRGLTGVRPWYQYHTSMNDPDFINYGTGAQTGDHAGLNRGTSNNRIG